MKFQGVKLPGGIELNGRQIYDDAINDLTVIREQMSNTYEIPPFRSDRLILWHLIHTSLKEQLGNKICSRSNQRTVEDVWC